MKKNLIRGMSGVVLLGIVVALTAWWLLRGSLPQT